MPRLTKGEREVADTDFHNYVSELLANTYQPLMSRQDFRRACAADIRAGYVEEVNEAERLAFDLTGRRD